MANTMKIRPNDKCPCGSGKKYKKCCKDKRPRSHGVWIDIAPIEDTKAKSLSGVSFDTESGRVFLHTPLGETVEAKHPLSVSEYERDNKIKSNKILCMSEGVSINNFPAQWYFSLHDHLSRFDIVSATDTNTMTINEEKISVGVMFRLYTKRTQVREGLFRYCIPKSAFSYRKTPNGIEEAIDAIWVGSVPIPVSSSRAICFRGLSGSDAEKYTVYQLVNRIISDNRNSPDIKVGIITDHLNAYRRNEPLYGDFSLPKNVNIIYASDAANETVLNFAVRKCHKEADGLLKELKDKGFIDIGKRIPFEEIPYASIKNS